MNQKTATAERLRILTFSTVYGAFLAQDRFGYRVGVCYQEYGRPTIAWCASVEDCDIIIQQLRRTL